MAPRDLANALAHAFLSGPRSEAAIRERTGYLLGREWPWVRPVIRRYVNRLSGGPDPTREDLAYWIANSRFFRFATEKFGPELRVQSWLLTASARARVAQWNLPKLDNVAVLTHWLAMDLDHLNWFADLHRYGYSTRNPKLENYTYRVVFKPGGSIRLIEAPKKTLKELQRRIARDLLALIPAHPAVHGFVPGRSIKTFVAPHTGKELVLRMDLHNFFPSIRAARVSNVFRTLGYGDHVAEYLTGLGTNAVPRRLWKNFSQRDNDVFELHNLYARRHLPQGAPTSPALANLCAYRLDVRLSALAQRAGATYTRYADDLAFSGDANFARCSGRFSIRVAAIALEESFAVNHHKTRFMRRGIRQHLAGLTANHHPNVSRRDFDQLKALLTNCLRHGPASQNREAHPDFRAHLFGRIGFIEMINSQKAAKLRRLYNQIHWN
jgi:RNA-directed DNA polymerase